MGSAFSTFNVRIILIYFIYIVVTRDRKIFEDFYLKKKNKEKAMKMCGYHSIMDKDETFLVPNRVITVLFIDFFLIFTTHSVVTLIVL